MYRHAVHDRRVRALGGGKLEYEVRVLLSLTSFVNWLDPVCGYELLGFPAVDGFEFS